MTELSEARAAAREMEERLARPAFTRMAHLEQVKLADEAARVIRALLTASAPVEGDEREALVKKLADELEYRVRTAATLHHYGHDIEPEVSNGRAAVERIAAGFRRPSTPTEEDVERAAVAYADHVTGYSMRDGGRTYTCRCGWSETGPEASAAALKHRARAALSAVHSEVTL